jgi:hypothetical protein
MGSMMLGVLRLPRQRKPGIGFDRAAATTLDLQFGPIKKYERRTLTATIFTLEQLIEMRGAHATLGLPGDELRPDIFRPVLPGGDMMGT